MHYHKVMKYLLTSALCLFLFVSQLLAWCSEPSVSYLYTPTKPSIPWCVNEFTNTHTCSEWEIDGYYDDIETYNNDVEEFIRQLNNYVDEATEYACCRVRELE